MIHKILVSAVAWESNPVAIRQRACRLGGEIEIYDLDNRLLAVIGATRTRAERRRAERKVRLELALSADIRALAEKHAAAQELSISRWVEIAIKTQARIEETGT